MKQIREIRNIALQIMASTSCDSIELAYKISKKLNCGISKDQLSACVRLIEEGAAPEAVAHVVNRLYDALAKRRSLELK